MRTLLLSTLLFSATLNAQTLTDQYIELSVSDTLSLVPTAYIYDLNVVDQEPVMENYDDNTDWERVQREQQERHTKALARLEKDVMGMGFPVERYTLGQEDPYSLQPEVEGVEPVLRITLKDQVELKRLVDGLRERKDVTGNIVRMDYEQGKDIQQELITRMYKKAEERSRTLATLGGRKLGKLLQVRTAGNEEFTFTDFMRIMEQERGGNEWMERYQNNVPQRMTFRFALID